MTNFAPSDFFAISPSRLSSTDIATAAAAHNLTPAHLWAIADVEGSGDGYLPDNRPKILFEAASFSKLTKHVYDASHPGISCPTWNRTLYRGGALEYARLAEAMQLDETAALSSCSWGLFQIMGSNHALAGYSDVIEFVRDHVTGGEHAHLEAVLTFLKASGLIDELARSDWSGFAKGYNGAGYATNGYDQKLQAAFERHGGKVAGQRNATELWRRLKKQGFRGCLRVVSEWATRRRQGEKADNALTRAPSARTVARLMTIDRDGLSKAETVTVAAIEAGVPLLVEAREVIAAFQAMVRKKALAELDPWLEQARFSLVASFANGVIKDKAAVSAAITSPWSNGQTEGQITKLKLVKRQMYGRGKLDLLQARVIGPA